MNIAKWERSEWMRPKVNSWQVGVSWGYQMVPTNCIITLSKNTFLNTSNNCKTLKNTASAPRLGSCNKSKVCAGLQNRWFPFYVVITLNRSSIYSNTKHLKSRCDKQGWFRSLSGSHSAVIIFNSKITLKYSETWWLQSSIFETSEMSHLIFHSQITLKHSKTWL